MGKNLSVCDKCTIRTISHCMVFKTPISSEANCLKFQVKLSSHPNVTTISNTTYQYFSLSTSSESLGVPVQDFSMFLLFSFLF